MGFDAEQQRNAQTIISVGRSLGASERDLTIALMTALQESGLRNINYGDRDSVGLFQQRAPWGSFEDRTNPSESARMFFQGGQTGQPGLFAKTTRDGMSLTQAAQAVQVSAFPDAYAKHEQAALGLLGGSSVGPDPTTGPGVPAAGAPALPSSSPGATSAGILDESQETVVQDQELDATEFGAREALILDTPADTSFLPSLTEQEFASAAGGLRLPGVAGHNDMIPEAALGGRKTAVRSALGYLGTPYVWGGQSRSGVDCSGLMLNAFAEAGIDLPRVSYQQAARGARIGLDALRPGDMVAWDNSPRNPGADHIAIYIGGGEIVEAARPGTNVSRRRLDPGEDAWGVDMSGAYRD